MTRRVAIACPGGGVCAALAWSGLFAGGPEEAVRRLDGFRRDLTATDPVAGGARGVSRLPAVPASLEGGRFARPRRGSRAWPSCSATADC
jgi:hypothetical protein